MRAICGAIICAGAMIGLGLAGIGVGTRFERLPEGAHFHQLDTPLILVIVLLVIGLVVGICVAFLGLMYHHHRRHHESLLHAPHDGGATQRVL